MADWDQLTSRGNVEDRRGAAPLVGGISGLGIILALGAFLLGGDPSQVLDLVTQVQPPISNQASEEFAGLDTYEEFASTVLGSTNELWRREFQERGGEYVEPRLVLFRQATQSGCGGASSRTGPHYCPADNTIYLDETFFDELTARYGARGGDVAEAYVIAHEVGHHIQNLNGTLASVSRRDNEASIAIELQADCYAGVWAGGVAEQGVIAPGEIEEALSAVAAVGDDRIQEQATGQINPETWTHGSSAQRTEAFTRGFETQEPAQCDYV